jgi:curved DNA-binding protein CbpA
MPRFDARMLLERRVNLPDPYKTLQVDPEAEDEVIEAAYRRLARKYHPDVAPGPDAQDRMVRINQAWEVLRDPTRRAALDRARTRTAGSAARAAAADARTAAADARARSAAQAASEAARSRTTPSQPRSAPRPQADPGSGPPAWGFPGVYDPGDGDFRARPQFVSPNWTSGRSQRGHGYDAGSMAMPQGEGAAGPPPGKPSGSLLNFGRYAGWSLGEVARVDLEYLEWLDRAPIGRIYQGEIDELLRTFKRRMTAPTQETGQRGLFRRR